MQKSPNCDSAPWVGSPRHVGARSRRRGSSSQSAIAPRGIREIRASRRSEPGEKRYSAHQRRRNAVVHAALAVAVAARDRLQAVAFEAPQARLALRVAVTVALAPVALASATSTPAVHSGGERRQRGRLSSGLVEESAQGGELEERVECHVIICARAQVGL